MEEEKKESGDNYLKKLAEIEEEHKEFIREYSYITDNLQKNIEGEKPYLIDPAVKPPSIQQGMTDFDYKRDYDMKLIALTSLFLGSKCTDSSRNIRKIIQYFYFTLQSSIDIESKKKTLDVTSSLFAKLKSEVIDSEILLLHSFGYEMHRFEHFPHKYLLLFCKSLKCSQNLVQIAFNFANDAYLSSACLSIPHTLIASASIFLAYKFSSEAMPKVPWWILTDYTLEMVERAARQIYQIYDIENASVKGAKRALERAFRDDKDYKFFVGFEKTYGIKTFEKFSFHSKIKDESSIEKNKSRKERDRQHHKDRDVQRRGYRDVKRGRNRYEADRKRSRSKDRKKRRRKERKLRSRSRSKKRRKKSSRKKKSHHRDESDNDKKDKRRKKRSKKRRKRRRSRSSVSQKSSASDAGGSFGSNLSQIDQLVDQDKDGKSGDSKEKGFDPEKEISEIKKRILEKKKMSGKEPLMD